MINRIVLAGRLTATPEERHSNEGTVISRFRIAVDRRRRNRDGEREADFFNIVCFGNSAEFANKYLDRGDLVGVEGRVEIDDYTDRDGQRQRWVSVVADNVQKLSWSRDGDRPERQDRGERSERGGGGDRGGRGGRGWDHAPDDFGDAEADRPAAGEGRRQSFEKPADKPAGDSFYEDEDDPFADE